jgi:hypothetical protein
MVIASAFHATALRDPLAHTIFLQYVCARFD